MWIGAKRYDGEWRWAGKTTGPATTILWEDSQPNFGVNDDCLGSWFGGQDGNTGKSHDAACNVSIHFVCELVL